MEKLLQLLDTIREKPRLFVGDGGLMALKHFVSGYCACLKAFGVEADAWWHGFEAYVHSAFGLPMNPQSLWTLTLERSASDDEAFELFFKLLDEFRNQ